MVENDIYLEKGVVSIMNMKKRFYFGKINFNQTSNRKINKIYVDVHLISRNDTNVLMINAFALNISNTNIVAGGDYCLETLHDKFLTQLENRELFEKIYKFAKLYGNLLKTPIYSTNDYEEIQEMLKLPAYCKHCKFYDSYSGECQRGYYTDEELKDFGVKCI